LRSSHHNLTNKWGPYCFVTRFTVKLRKEGPGTRGIASVTSSPGGGADKLILRSLKRTKQTSLTVEAHRGGYTWGRVKQGVLPVNDLMSGLSTGHQTSATQICEGAKKGKAVMRGKRESRRFRLKRER